MTTMETSRYIEDPSLTSNPNMDRLTPGVHSFDPELAGEVNSARSDLVYLLELSSANRNEALTKHAKAHNLADNEYRDAEAVHREAIAMADAKLAAAKVEKDTKMHDADVRLASTNEDASTAETILAGAEKLLKTYCKDYIATKTEKAKLLEEIDGLSELLESTMGRKSEVDSQVMDCLRKLQAAKTKAKEAEAQKDVEERNLMDIEKMSVKMTTDQSNSASVLYDQVSQRLDSNVRQCVLANEIVKKVSQHHNDLGLTSLRFDEEISTIKTRIDQLKNDVGDNELRTKEIEEEIYKLHAAIKQVHVKNTSCDEPAIDSTSNRRGVTISTRVIDNSAASISNATNLSIIQKPETDHSASVSSPASDISGVLQERAWGSGVRGKLIITRNNTRGSKA